MCAFATAAVISVLIGAVTLSGSLVAYGKLAGKVNGSRIGPLGSGAGNVALALATALAAFGLAAWVVPGDGADLTVYGQYHDVLERRDGRWGFTERRILVSGDSGSPVRWNRTPRSGRD